MKDSHEWILDAILDIREVCNDTALPETRQALDQAMSVAIRELDSTGSSSDHRAKASTSQLH